MIVAADLTKFCLRRAVTRSNMARMDSEAPDSPATLDRLDLKLLRELFENGRATHYALSERVGLSPSAIARRQRALEQDGLIEGYEAKLNMRRLGNGTIAHIKVSLGSQSASQFDAFEAAVAQSPSVVRCELMSGTDDYLITVLARSLDHFAQIHREELSRLPGVVRMESGFVLREVVKPRIPPYLFATIT